MIDVYPIEGNCFTLRELKNYIGGGYIEAVSLYNGKILICDEDGKQKGLPVNSVATLYCAIPNDTIVGNVLICDRSELD